MIVNLVFFFTLPDKLKPSIKNFFILGNRIYKTTAIINLKKDLVAVELNETRRALNQEFNNVGGLTFKG